MKCRMTCAESLLVEQSLNHRIKRIDALFGDRFVAGDFSPCIEKVVIGEQRTHFRIDSITDHAQRVVFHQFRNIAGITNRQLFISVMNRGVFACRTFEFKDHQRQTVDIQNAIGNSFFASFDFQLIDDSINVVVGSGVVVAQFFRDTFEDLRLPDFGKAANRQSPSTECKGLSFRSSRLNRKPSETILQIDRLES